MKKGQKVTYRLVKVKLSTGETEILMSNLDDTFTIKDLSYIYKCRWGIEDCFKVLKSNLMLCIFSGLSAHVVLQDIWSNLHFYNLHTITLLAAEKELQKINKKRKANPSKNKKKENKGYKMNRNTGLSALKSSFFTIFISKSVGLTTEINKLKQVYLDNLELVCDKNPPRGSNKLYTRERNSTEANYKRGF